ncbi:MAG: hypothetical protein AAGD32_18385, partial [Planctomycetota bacterium]
MNPMTDNDAPQNVSPASTDRGPAGRSRLALAAALVLPAITAGTVLAETAVDAPAADEPMGDAQLVGYMTQNLSGPELLESAAGDMRAGRYEEALAKLQQIDPASLSGSEAASYNAMVDEAGTAARERRVARAQFEAGEQAQADGDLPAAATAYYAAQQNAFADAGTRAKAREEFALVGEKLKAQVDAKSLYQTAKREYNDGSYDAARPKLIVLEAIGFRAPAFQSSPRVILGKIERAAGPVVVAVDMPETAVPAMADESVETPSVETPAEVADASVTESTEMAESASATTVAATENSADAIAAYELGMRQYRAKDYDSAKASMARAQELGYTPGAFEDSPEKVLERIASLQAGGSAAGTTVAAQEEVEFVPATDASTQPDVAATLPANDLESAARAEQLKRAQDAAKADALVAEARQAESAGELARATELYNEALGFNPGNRAANEGRNRMIGARGLDPRQESLITKFEKEVEAERQAIQYQIANAITEAQASLDGNDFNSARNSIQQARLQRNLNPLIFTDAEL